ncbi:winged helix-turn-helix transcriptional regulator [Martelella endophytica]|uniref:HTH marR-type domain-containing protein n=1 Tax=Martelella endophytica TaxID=1486262 RepID=A0A0D5LV61_MAREN|nr:winged helix-turn-helix transcriptional regulator [Martelella endophytica]AJY47647.1 hypothetical protein TM49_21400 [Martelella endophytica]
MDAEGFGWLAGNRQGLSGISTADIADHNSRVLIATLRENGAMSRRALAAALGLSETAIAGIVRRLMGAGYLEQRKRSDGGRGTVFFVVEGAATGIGIHLTSTGAGLAHTDIGGHLLAEGTAATASDAEAWVTAARGGGGKLAGLAIACDEAMLDEARALARRFVDIRVDWVRDTEAALRCEQLCYHTRTERGLAVILLDETVRAGTMFSGRFFQGAHGRAGAIGAMRPASHVSTLSEVASATSYALHMKDGKDEAAWIAHAASRLLDAIMAISGFVSPDAVRIGGRLPDTVLDRLIAEIVADKALKAGHFIAADWIPDVTRLEGGMRAIARGAAMVPLRYALLPLETAPFD